MTRAHAIWMLVNDAGKAFGAFTVKHELLQAIRAGHPEDIKGWSVSKCADATLGCVIQLGSATQFLEANE